MKPEIPANDQVAWNTTRHYDTGALPSTIATHDTIALGRSAAIARRDTE